MNYTISSASIKSDPHRSYPNGELIARGSVNYFENTAPRSPNTPTKVADLIIINYNGASFFKSDRVLSISTIRAIANALSEIADKAQEAHDDLIKVNASGFLDKRNNNS
jgi:hypothetical protein